MTLKLDFRRAALADLDQIWDFTAAHWDVAQADHYVTVLHAQMQRLIDWPAIGVSVEYLAPGLRRIGSGSHHIYYREEAGRVSIVRILHMRMDPAAAELEH